MAGSSPFPGSARRRVFIFTTPALSSPAPLTRCRPSEGPAAALTPARLPAERTLPLPALTPVTPLGEELPRVHSRCLRERRRSPPRSVDLPLHRGPGCGQMAEAEPKQYDGSGACRTRAATPTCSSAHTALFCWVILASSKSPSLHGIEEENCPSEGDTCCMNEHHVSIMSSHGAVRAVGFSIQH